MALPSHYRNVKYDPVHKHYRVTYNGYRHYAIEHNKETILVPSVTSILSAVQPFESKQRLAIWNLENPGMLEKAAERGTWIHNAAEGYLLGHKVSPPLEYAGYWRGVAELLDNLLEEGAEILWSEKPFGKMQHKWNPHTLTPTGLGRVFYYDSHSKMGYSGAPDLIYELNGEVVLCDFKTSAGPYVARFPSKQAKEDACVTPEEEKKFFGGMIKYNKTCAQLAAYAQALDFTLGLKVDKMRIFVSTDAEGKLWDLQKFTLPPWTVERSKQNWNACFQAYYNNEKVDPFTPRRRSFSEAAA